MRKKVVDRETVRERERERDGKREEGKAEGWRRQPEGLEYRDSGSEKRTE